LLATDGLLYLLIKPGVLVGPSRVTFVIHVGVRVIACSTCGYWSGE
jgi:hypothetical protein